jgi:hypothetical protein
MQKRDYVDFHELIEFSTGRVMIRFVDDEGRRNLQVALPDGRASDTSELTQVRDFC